MLSILRRPDSVRIIAEEKENDASVRFSLEKDGLHVHLKAPTSRVKFLILRWNTPIREEISILGDTWERSYADLGFVGLTTEKAHPWYFAARRQNGTDCVGVGVQPNAFIHFTIDCEGITAYCDLRAGTVGVSLGKRELEVATFMSEEYESDPFTALCDFCKKMSPKPLLPKEKVYGGNNWYYAYGDSSYEEIAARLGVNKKAVDNAVQRIRRKLYSRQ